MKYILLTGAIFAIFFLPSSSIAEQGRLSEDIVHSRALEGNRTGDSPDRSVLVYLPPGYDSATERRYPVLYLLHGNGGNNTDWVKGVFQDMKINLSVDSLISAGYIHEMIIVMPDAHNRYKGSHYVNSSTTGNWADFITRDLVQYIDTTYRTIPRANARGLSGWSMGGRATLYLALTYPGIYGAIYGLSSGQMDFGELAEKPDNPQWWSKLLSLQDVAEADPMMMRTIGLAAAFSPNPNQAPFYLDFQYGIVDGKVEPRPDIWQKWLAHDPVVLVPSHASSLQGLLGIRFDYGLSDRVLPGNRAFSRALTKAGIAHTYDEYDGNHNDRIRERIESHVLPFFSDVLESKE